jgi:hypothetical protein
LPDVQPQRAVLAMKNELVDEALSLIRAAGFEPNIVRGRHLKIYWVDHLGHTQCLVVSYTPSDWRARTRSRAVLRRLLRVAS